MIQIIFTNTRPFRTSITMGSMNTLVKFQMTIYNHYRIKDPAHHRRVSVLSIPTPAKSAQTTQHTGPLGDSRECTAGSKAWLGPIHPQPNPTRPNPARLRKEVT